MVSDGSLKHHPYPVPASSCYSCLLQLLRAFREGHLTLHMVAQLIHVLAKAGELMVPEAVRLFQEVS